MFSPVAAAWAHGGEDHSAPAAPRAAAAGNEHVLSGETTGFSVVLKYSAKKGVEPLQARIYLARADTSIPVSDATIRLELKGDSPHEEEGKKTDMAGVYEVSLPVPPEGTKSNGIISVQLKDDFDLVLLGELPFGPMEAALPPVRDGSRQAPAWGLVVAVGVFAGAFGFAIGRRSQRGGRAVSNSTKQPLSG
jgi:hypothetical protein